MYDIIIIGAGVSGCACARELSRYDAKILVVEKEEDVCCGTSKANSAIVHAGYDAAHGSLMAKLNVEGSRRMPALAKELDFAYDRCGSLVVCLSDEDRPALQKLYENGIANGVEGLRIIERDELVGMEPNISDAAVAALWAPTGGIVCPFGLTFALAENAAKNGVQFRFDTKVTSLHPLDGGGTGWAVETDHGTLETRCIVNAAGVYADTLHNMADAAHPMTITARRGDYFLLDHTAGQHVRQRGQGPQAAQRMLQGRGRIGLGGQHGFHPGEAVAKNVMQAFLRAEQVGQHGEGTALDPREQQCRGFGAEGPALDVRQLQIGVHGNVDTAQLSDLFQIGHTFLKVTVAHQSSSPAGSTGASVRSPASQRPKSARMRAWSKQMGCGSLSRG